MVRMVRLSIELDSTIAAELTKRAGTISGTFAIAATLFNFAGGLYSERERKRI